MRRPSIAFLALLVVLPLLLSLATQSPFGNVAKPPVVYFPSPHYNQRPPDMPVDMIVLHHTDRFASTWAVARFFQQPGVQASAHYVVGKEGLIIQCVPDDRAAWHAGPSIWGERPGVNDYSIGIELVNDGDGADPYTERQYDALARLVAHLMSKYRLTLDRVVGHKDVAIPLGRKPDPSSNFDWLRLRVAAISLLTDSVPPTPFGDDEPNRQLLIAATAVLVDRARVAALREAAVSTDPWTRAMAVYMLGLIKDPSSLPELRLALKDQDALVRKWAVNGIQSFPAEFVREELRQIAAGDAQTRVRWAAIDALADLRDRGSLPLLRGFLQEPRTPVDVLVATLHALMYLGDASDGPLVTGLLKDQEQPDEVRAAAAVTLQSMGIRSSAPALAAVLAREQESQQVRLAVLWALNALGASPPHDVLNRLQQHADPLLRSAALEAWRRAK